VAEKKVASDFVVFERSDSEARHKEFNIAIKRKHMFEGVLVPFWV